MIEYSISEKTDTNQTYITFPFYKNGKTLTSAKAGMTLKNCGSMRFRWNENNENRVEKLCAIKNELHLNKDFVPVELIHSKDVIAVNTESDSFKKTVDGIITKNHQLIPTVTVADCMPLFLFDDKTGVFGVVHSGWKGTGIIENALILAEKEYGCNRKDFSVIIGPHIHDCCYIVNEERTDYFSKNFTPDCIKPLEEGGSCYCGGRGLAIDWNNGGGKLFRLSLQKANLWILEKAGVPSDNICVINDCTCCNELFGSNRRETALAAKNIIPQEQLNNMIQPFTVQAAFVYKE